MRRGKSRSYNLAMIGLVVVVSLSVAACSSKRKGGFSDEDLAGQPSTGFDDEMLAGAPSIEQFETTGTVASGGEFEDVRFGFDSDRLSDSATMSLQSNAQILQANPSLRVEIEGHCDDRGAAEYNLALGARRARAVRDALVGLGVSSDRLSTVSFGEELPLCKEASESCWATNRRAHFVAMGR